MTRETFRCTIQFTRCFWVYATTKRVLVGLGTWNSQSLENQEEKDYPQTYEPGTIYESQQDLLTLQETSNEIKLIGKEIEICQIDRTISTHRDTNALSINTMTKIKKQIVQQEIQPRDQIWSLPNFKALKIFKQIYLFFIFQLQ
jgi:hypothetical protein